IPIRQSPGRCAETRGRSTHSALPALPRGTRAARSLSLDPRRPAEASPTPPHTLLERCQRSGSRFVGGTTSRAASVLAAPAGNIVDSERDIPASRGDRRGAVHIALLPSSIASSLRPRVLAYLTPLPRRRRLRP